MRIVVQRVKWAKVEVAAEVVGSIDQGLLVFLGIEDADDKSDADWLIRKVSQLRIFNDDDGQMNRSLLDLGGSLLVISQFTLFAATKKGNRPSYIRAAAHQHAIPLYEYFVQQAENVLDGRVATGMFGADMQVSSLNDGPVTIAIDSKNRE
ncbi:MAG: D-aminoacyl-tRNA deacylase [Flavobacteriaceae bacterium]